MGRKGQAALGAGAHEEEFAELQRRFDALSSAKKLSETSPALLTKDMYRTEKKQQAVRYMSSFHWVSCEWKPLSRQKVRKSLDTSWRGT